MLSQLKISAKHLKKLQITVIFVVSCEVFRTDQRNYSGGATLQAEVSLIFPTFLGRSKRPLLAGYGRANRPHFMYLPNIHVICNVCICAISNKTVVNVGKVF